MSSADNLFKQFGSRPGPRKCRAWSGSKLFDTLMVFLKEIFEKVDFEKISRRQMQNYPACNKLMTDNHSPELFTPVTVRVWENWKSKYKIQINCVFILPKLLLFHRSEEIYTQNVRKNSWYSLTVEGCPFLVYIVQVRDRSHYQHAT